MSEINTNQTIEEIKNEYEERLAELEAENARLRAAEDAASAKLDGELAAAEAYLEEYVDVKLFRDSDKYTDDVYVAVNGQNCIIKRGEWVKIKRKFALVLDQSEIQDMKASALMSGAAVIE